MIESFDREFVARERVSKGDGLFNEKIIVLESLEERMGLDIDVNADIAGSGARMLIGFSREGENVSVLGTLRNDNVEAMRFGIDLVTVAVSALVASRDGFTGTVASGAFSD